MTSVTDKLPDNSLSSRESGFNKNSSCDQIKNKGTVNVVFYSGESNQPIDQKDIKILPLDGVQPIKIPAVIDTSATEQVNPPSQIQSERFSLHSSKEINLTEDFSVLVKILRIAASFLLDSFYTDQNFDSIFPNLKNDSSGNEGREPSNKGSLSGLEKIEKKYKCFKSDQKILRITALSLAILTFIGLVFLSIPFLVPVSLLLLVLTVCVGTGYTYAFYEKQKMELILNRDSFAKSKV